MGFRKAPAAFLAGTYNLFVGVLIATLYLPALDTWVIACFYIADSPITEYDSDPNMDAIKEPFS